MLGGVRSLSGHGVPGRNGLEASVHVSCGVVNKFDVAKREKLVEPNIAMGNNKAFSSQSVYLE